MHCSFESNEMKWIEAESQTKRKERKQKQDKTVRYARIKNIEKSEQNPKQRRIKR